MESCLGWSAIESQNKRCTSWRRGADTEHLIFDFARAICFGNEFFKRRYLVIPLDESRYSAKPSYGFPIEPPHRCRDRVIVSVDQQISRNAVTCQVNLAYPLCWNSCEILRRREAVIDGADVDIVNVQQNAAVSFVSDSGSKNPLWHSRN